MEYEYTCKGTCSRTIRFALNDDHTVSGVSFEGGCNGNLKGIASLTEGQKAEDVIARLEGLKCGMKPTSCPDQLAQALRAALKEKAS
ncbi:MAG: TIGR03905 family TSCPD domain-containing protein [Oscillospiraceae bacterium]|nr:TIGR03905 family TSCPD domain-containing protein [Oscillospiraceae bacterium]